MTEHLIQFNASDSAGTSFTALIRTHSKWNQILHFSGQILYCLTVSTIYEVLLWQIKHTYRGAGVNALLQGLDFLLLGLFFFCRLVHQTFQMSLLICHLRNTFVRVRYIWKIAFFYINGIINKTYVWPHLKTTFSDFDQQKKNNCWRKL